MIKNNSGNSKSASDKVVLGLIGAGGRGTYLILNIRKTCPGVDVKYICDVDEARGGRAIQELAKGQSYEPLWVKDMRRVFDDKEVDAVVIATPEHWHALAFIWACQAGKDIFIEKNLSQSIPEGLKMVAAARKYNNIVQVGTQNRSGDYAFSARNYISSGKLGQIVSVKSNCLLSGDIAWSLKPDSPVPETLDWDMWLGPAPKVPYNVSRHKAAYDWWEYSPGLQMAMAAHVVDLTRMVLGDPDCPKSVYCAGGRFLYDDERAIPDMQSVTYEYNDYSLTLEGAKFGNYMAKSSPEVRFGNKFPDWGLNSTRIEIYGTEGLMLLGIMGGGWQIIGEGGEVKEQEFGYFPDDLHQKNFFDCIRQNKRATNADIVQGHKGATLIHLANLAYRVGKKQLYYDSKEGKILNSDLANKVSEGTYREAYALPKEI
jgi:predicted dehydrogenase